MSDFEERELHFIAIGGAGMSGLALAAQTLGARVTGSDRTDSSYLRRVIEAGIDARVGHDPNQVPPEAEVVISTAIGEDNPELARARERGLRVLHRSELLAELAATRRVVAVAGAHGKTTTAGMLAHILRVAGSQAGFLLGGELPGAGGAPAANAEWGAGEWLVVEADESDRSFLRLDPEVAVITNIELDHHSNWSSEAELFDGFGHFAAPAHGLVLPAGAAYDRLDPDSAVRFALPEARPGAGAGANLIADAVEPVAGGIEFTVAGAAAGAAAGERVRLAVPGRHNVADALAAIGALIAAGPDAGLPAAVDAVGALASFPGMARRLERKGESSGAAVYDDYAHHPTEVAASLAALAELPHERLIAIFQPHLYSRTKALAPRFGRALAAADEVAVLDVYAAREQPVGPLAGVSGRQVAEAVAAAAPGKTVWWLPELGDAAASIGPRLGPGDIVVTIGAGDVFRVGERLVAPEAEGAAQ
jgi:UDP-N-acetylmuramate--alanine ligase